MVIETIDINNPSFVKEATESATGGRVNSVKQPGQAYDKPTPRDKIILNRIIGKMTKGDTNFTDEELEVQSNWGSHLEELLKAKAYGDAPRKGKIQSEAKRKGEEERLKRREEKRAASEARKAEYRAGVDARNAERARIREEKAARPKRPVGRPKQNQSGFVEQNIGPDTADGPSERVIYDDTGVIYEESETDAEYARRRGADALKATKRAFKNLTTFGSLPEYRPPNFNFERFDYQPLEYDNVRHPYFTKSGFTPLKFTPDTWKTYDTFKKTSFKPLDYKADTWATYNTFNPKEYEYTPKTDESFRFVKPGSEYTPMEWKTEEWQTQEWQPSAWTQDTENQSYLGGAFRGEGDINRFLDTKAPEYKSFQESYVPLAETYRSPAYESSVDRLFGKPGESVLNAPSIKSTGVGEKLMSNTNVPVRDLLKSLNHGVDLWSDDTKYKAGETIEQYSARVANNAVKLRNDFVALRTHIGEMTEPVGYLLDYVGNGIDLWAVDTKYRADESAGASYKSGETLEQYSARVANVADRIRNDFEHLRQRIRGVNGNVLELLDSLKKSVDSWDDESRYRPGETLEKYRARVDVLAGRIKNDFKSHKIRIDEVREPVGKLFDSLGGGIDTWAISAQYREGETLGQYNARMSAAADKIKDSLGSLMVRIDEKAPVLSFGSEFISPEYKSIRDIASSTGIRKRMFGETPKHNDTLQKNFGVSAPGVLLR